MSTNNNSNILRLAAMLVALLLAWSLPAFCGEIHDAARHGDLAKVTALLKDNPAIVNQKDADGGTPLHYATANGYKDIAVLLVNNKADVTARDRLNQTPLHYAASFGYQDIAALLPAVDPAAAGFKKIGAMVTTYNNGSDGPVDQQWTKDNPDGTVDVLTVRTLSGKIIGASLRKYTKSEVLENILDCPLSSWTWRVPHAYK